MCRGVLACGDVVVVLVRLGKTRAHRRFIRPLRRCSQLEAWWSCAAMRLCYHTIEPHLLRAPSHFYMLPRLSSASAAKLGPGNRSHFLSRLISFVPKLSSFRCCSGNSSCDCNKVYIKRRIYRVVT